MCTLYTVALKRAIDLKAIVLSSNENTPTLIAAVSNTPKSVNPTYTLNPEPSHVTEP